MGETNEAAEGVPVGLKTKSWYQSKTIWVGLAALVTAVGGYFTGEMTLGNALQTALTAAMGIFIRQGIGTPIGTPDGTV